MSDKEERYYYDQMMNYFEKEILVNPFTSKKNDSKKSPIIVNKIGQRVYEESIPVPKYPKSLKIPENPRDPIDSCDRTIFRCVQATYKILQVLNGISGDSGNCLLTFPKRQLLQITRYEDRSVEGNEDGWSIIASIRVYEIINIKLSQSEEEFGLVLQYEGGNVTTEFEFRSKDNFDTVILGLSMGLVQTVFMASIIGSAVVKFSEFNEEDQKFVTVEKKKLVKFWFSKPTKKEVFIRILDTTPSRVHKSMRVSFEDKKYRPSIKPDPNVKNGLIITVKYDLPRIDKVESKDFFVINNERDRELLQTFLLKPFGMNIDDIMSLITSKITSKIQSRNSFKKRKKKSRNIIF